MFSDLLSFDAWDWAGELVGLVVLALVLADVLRVWRPLQTPDDVSAT